MIIRACLAVLLVGCVTPSGEDLALDTAAMLLDDGSLEAELATGEDEGEDDDGLRMVVGLGPTPVFLGGPRNPAGPGAYALLASTAITNVTGTDIWRGNVGLSPAAGTFITGFALVADPTNQFSTSVSVRGVGRVFAATDAPPTPAKLTLAVQRMQLAYTDAAGRTLPDFLNLNSGDLGGLTLAPGLYTWGSTVTIPTDVTISGGSNDVWIFQIANDLDVSAAQAVILAGGARARNIFWQVAGQATIHEYAHFEGIILSQTAVTLQTGATLHGRILAQSQIALDDNIIVGP